MTEIALQIHRLPSDGDEEAVASTCSSGSSDGQLLKVNRRRWGWKEASYVGIAILLLSVGGACIGVALTAKEAEAPAASDVAIAAATPPEETDDDDDDAAKFVVVEVLEDESSSEGVEASSDSFLFSIQSEEDAHAQDVVVEGDSGGEIEESVMHQPSEDVDLFLLSGQSNMIGYTTSLRSITDDDTHWLELKSILEREGPEMEDELFAEIEATNWRKEESEAVAATLSAGLMDLHNAGLLRDIDAPLEYGRCSFLRPSRQSGDTSIGESAPLGWNAGCGRDFGSEFTFGRSLEWEMGYNRTAFELVKVAVGGTQIHKDWSPANGTYWNALRRSIASGSGEGHRWKAFVWHQGETDGTFQRDADGRVIVDAEDTSLTYLGNLTALVGQVREEMFAASEAGTWECKEQIPAIVVQVGYTPQTEMAARVREAQAQFCREDSRAILVKTDDLSRFYHMDAASMLVIGHRVAQAYREALQMNVTCPEARF